MTRSNNRAIPVAHHYIVTVLETVRAGTIADALLAFLKLFKQAKVAGNYALKPD